MKRLVWLLVVLMGIVGICAFAQEQQMSLPEGAVARLGLGNVNDVKFSPDGKYLAVATSVGIELRDAVTLKMERLLTGHTDKVWSVAFSPNGKTLASGSIDHTIKLWDVATGSLIRTLTGHTDYVRSVAFSPDGRTVASGSDDKTIKLWDVSTGIVIRTLTSHTYDVYSLTFSPEGPPIGIRGRNDQAVGCKYRDRHPHPCRPYGLGGVGCLLARWENPRFGIRGRNDQAVGCEYSECRPHPHWPYKMGDLGCLLPRWEDRRLWIMG